MAKFIFIETQGAEIMHINVDQIVKIGTLYNGPGDVQLFEVSFSNGDKIIIKNTSEKEMNQILGF